jgi:hypothetical protein
MTIPVAVEVPIEMVPEASMLTPEPLIMVVPLKVSEATASEIPPARRPTTMEVAMVGSVRFRNPGMVLGVCCQL